MTEVAVRTAGAWAGRAVAAPADTLASRALGATASKRVAAPSLLSERLLHDLAEAVRDGDGSGRAEVVREMLASGLRREDIADFYIPEVARRLGAAWCDDRASFADVSIGVARLQGLVRMIGPDWFSDAHLDPDAPCILAVVFAGESHTLGATLLGAQLGRLGMSVKIVMDRNEARVLDVVARGKFDAVFLSVSQELQLAAVKVLVKKIRAVAVKATPVVLGGSVVTRVTDAKTQTGADHATTDAREALRACGLTISTPGARRRTTSE